MPLILQIQQKLAKPFHLTFEKGTLFRQCAFLYHEFSDSAGPTKNFFLMKIAAAIAARAGN